MCTIFIDEIALCVNSSNLSFSVIYRILPLLLLHCTTDKRLSSSSQTSLLFITIVSPLRHKRFSSWSSSSVPSITLRTHTCCLPHSRLPQHTASSFKSTKLLLFLTFIIPPCALPANSTQRPRTSISRLHRSQFLSHSIISLSKSITPVKSNSVTT